MRAPQKRRASTGPKARKGESISRQTERVGVATKVARKATKAPKALRTGAGKSSPAGVGLKKTAAVRSGKIAGKIAGTVGRRPALAGPTPRVVSHPVKGAAKNPGPRSGRRSGREAEPGSSSQLGSAAPGLSVTGEGQQGEGRETKRMAKSPGATVREVRADEFISDEEIAANPTAAVGGAPGGAGDADEVPLLPIPIASFTV